jgi:hypothetical protein
MLLLVEIYAPKVTTAESSPQERPPAARQLFYPTKEQVLSQSASSARLVPTVFPPLRLMIQISALWATILRLVLPPPQPLAAYRTTTAPRVRLQ